MDKRVLLLVVVLVAIGAAIAATAPHLAQGDWRPSWSGATRTELGTPSGEELGDAAAVYEPIAAYPPPPWPGIPTPRDRSEWAYPSTSADDVAAITLRDLVARGWASPDTQVLHARDFSGDDAASLGQESRDVSAGSPIDVAVTLKGGITSWMPGSYGVEQTPHPYAVIIVDREYGSPYSLALYDSLEQVPSLFR